MHTHIIWKFLQVRPVGGKTLWPKSPTSSSKSLSQMSVAHTVQVVTAESVCYHISAILNEKR